MAGSIPAASSPFFGPPGSGSGPGQRMERMEKGWKKDGKAIGHWYDAWFGNPGDDAE